MANHIPLTEEPKPWVPIQPANEKFVRLMGGDTLDIAMQYPLQGLTTATTACYVREEVYRRLLLAAEQLPAGYRLRVWDAWRPLALQQELYTLYAAPILERLGLTNAPAEVQRAATAPYISYPNADPLSPPVHTTGGAVDVTIVDEQGRELAMGTAFDEFGEKTTTAWFEGDGRDVLIRDNRRLLYRCMTEAGFTNLPSEWWHYDYGDAFWGYYTQSPTRYAGAFTEEDLQIRNEEL